MSMVNVVSDVFVKPCTDDGKLIALIGGEYTVEGSGPVRKAIAVDINGLLQLQIEVNKAVSQMAADSRFTIPQG